MEPTLDCAFFWLQVVAFARWQLERSSITAFATVTGQVGADSFPDCLAPMKIACWAASSFEWLSCQRVQPFVHLLSQQAAGSWQQAATDLVNGTACVSSAEVAFGFRLSLQHHRLVVKYQDGSTAASQASDSKIVSRSMDMQTLYASFQRRNYRQNWQFQLPHFPSYLYDSRYLACAVA